MKWLSSLMLLVALGASAGPCVNLGGQAYCLAWSGSNKNLDTYEYTLAGETVDNWQNLVTIQRFRVRPSFADFIDAQDAQLRKSGASPHWIALANPIHTHEAGTAATLTSGSDTEYTLFYFFEDDKQPIRGVIFSRRKALAGGEPPSRAQLEKWIAQMREMSPP